MRAAVLIALLACGKSDDKSDPPELAGCKAGDGSACFVLGVRYQHEDGDQHLDRSIDAWTRGCEHGNGPSCGQLGTIVEFGMSGRKANPAVARSFYARACKGRDQMSCKNLGIEPPPGDFDWTPVLRDVLGDKPGLGPMFATFELGAQLDAATQRQVSAWEKTAKAHVRVDVADSTTRGGRASLELRFDTPKLAPVLLKRWGKPDFDFGAWVDASRHRIITVGGNERGSMVFVLPYRSIDELVLPDDPTRLGLEPIPLVGARIADVQAALGATHVFADSDTFYEWSDYGTGPITVRVTTKRDVIARAQLDIITNSAALTAALVAALTRKYGQAKTTATKLVWTTPRHHHVTADTPTSTAGSITLVLD